ncbi:helix-hairpin-helix domain-containing protein [Frigoribacterium sp. 2-23]|uniref:helix-hairpin-helix domain-containing protein n=1 Tax=Frigoribacterium sp. 2-23 TaxID=3415006 RepID=UPI003C6F268C
MTVSFSSAPDPGQPRGPRWRVGIGAVVVLTIVVLGVGIAVSSFAAGGGSSTDEVGALVTAFPSGGSSGAGDPVAANGASGAVFVHVLGQVVAPGLYELSSGSRVVDVVSAAGGFTAEADQGAVNLARPLVDAEQIIVPAVGEAVPESVPGDRAAGGLGVGAAGAPSGRVNLNTADATALQTLPGVGPATSAAILGWRQQNGRFASVDDLLGVTGIGEKTVERLRALVTV